MSGKGAPSEAVVIVKAEVDEEIKPSAATAAAGSSDGGTVPAAGAAAAADSTAAASAGGGEATEAGTRLVEMPESHVRWILSQEVAPVFTLDDNPVASQEDFFRYQAWVRDMYEKDGRVMIPEDLSPLLIDEVQYELNRISLQEEVDLIFAQANEEFERDNPDTVALLAELQGKTDEDGNPIWGAVPPQLRLQ